MLEQEQGEERGAEERRGDREPSGDQCGLLRRAGGVAVLLVATLLASSPLLGKLGNWGIQDWDQHTLHHAVARQSMLEFGEAPLWNPYNDGGVPLLANPESRALAPGFGLTLLFGEIVGPKLEIVVHQLLAMGGAALWIRSFGIGSAAAGIAGLVFGLNTWFAFHLSVGHTWALNIAYLPWALLCQRRSRRAPVYVIPAAALLVVMFFGGGVYPLVMAGILMALQGAIHAALQRDPARQLALLAAIAAIALPLAAVKLLPAQELMSRAPRTTTVEGGYTAPGLVDAALHRDQTRAGYARRGQPPHALYLGALPLLLVAIGGLARPKTALPFLGAALLPLWIAMGTEIRPSLWAALHALPLFENMRQPPRFGIAAVLPLCVVLGLGIEALARRLRDPRLRGLALGAVAVWLVADLAGRNRQLFADAFPIPARDIQREAEFQQLRHQPAYAASGSRRGKGLHTTTSGLYPSFLANRGVVDGYQVVPLPRNALGRGSPGYRGEVFLDGSLGSARISSWSPNRVRVELQPAAPDLLVMNQNFDPGWRVLASPGREVLATRGLVSTPVGPGDDVVTFYYRPPRFVAGAWISGLSLAALPGLAWWLRRGAAGRPASEGLRPS